MWESLYKKIYNNLLDFKKNFFSDNKNSGNIKYIIFYVKKGNANNETRYDCNP